MSRSVKVVSRRSLLKAGVAANVGLLAGCSSEFDVEQTVSFGVITDVQYADADSREERIYRKSPEKLKVAVDHLNTMDLDFVIHLGDLIDRDFFSYSTVLPIMRRIEAPVAYVLGNHDYEVADDKKSEVPTHIGMSAKHYDFVIGNWRFVVLDGNDISLHAHAKGSDAYNEAAAMLERLKAQNAAFAKPWNAAIDSDQLSWLYSRLAQATQARQKVIVFCHWPIHPDVSDGLWNYKEVLARIESFDCVPAFLAGHYHPGGYGVRKGIHHVTFRAMLDGEDRTSYAVVRCDKKTIQITGYGDEVTRTLT